MQPLRPVPLPCVPSSDRQIIALAHKHPAFCQHLDPSAAAAAEGTVQHPSVPPLGGTKQGSPPLRNHLLETELAPARPAAPPQQPQPMGGGGGGTTPAPITMQGGHCGTTPAPLRPQYGWGGALPPASAGHMAATPASNILRPTAQASASGAAAVSAGAGAQGGRGQALRLTSGQYKIPGG